MFTPSRFLLLESLTTIEKKTIQITSSKTRDGSLLFQLRPNSSDYQNVNRREKKETFSHAWNNVFIRKMCSRLLSWLIWKLCDEQLTSRIGAANFNHLDWFLHRNHLFVFSSTFDEQRKIKFIRLIYSLTFMMWQNSWAKRNTIPFCMRKSFLKFDH